jgi:hypothetical protein
MKATRLLLMLPLLLAACGGSASTAGTPTSPPATTPTQGEGSGDPQPTSQGTPGGEGTGGGLCAALTLDEVTAAAGVTATAAMGSSLQGQTSCNYNAADGTPVARHVYTTTESVLVPSALFDGLAANGEAVSGVGDRAVWVGVEGTELGSLYVMVGDNMYNVSVMTSDPASLDRSKSASIDLARLAVPRLN